MFRFGVSDNQPVISAKATRVRDCRIRVRSYLNQPRPMILCHHIIDISVNSSISASINPYPLTVLLFLHVHPAFTDCCETIPPKAIATSSPLLTSHLLLKAPFPLSRPISHHPRHSKEPLPPAPLPIPRRTTPPPPALNRTPTNL